MVGENSNSEMLLPTYFSYFFLGLWL